MKQYRDLVEHVLTNGVRQSNRTGVNTLKCNGYMMKFNLAEGFPLLTLKRTPFKMIIGEMLAFLRGIDNVKGFNELGVKVWDANAEAEYWTNNPYYKGEGDLGRIYGVQARCWKKPICSRARSKSTLGMSFEELEGTDFYYNFLDDIIYQSVDQLKQVVDNLSKGIDDRRAIVTHWNPGELDQMALPPCHLLYQFGITGNKLNLSMYQRSCDIGLGVPFNIAGYSWLLHMIAHITGLEAGTFTHFLHDVHIYENHIEGMKELLTREDRPLPELIIPSHIDTLNDLETWVTPDHFGLKGYNPYEAIKLPMAV
jgi:thymidylate synthase